jgi:hypothetical protein
MKKKLPFILIGIGVVAALCAALIVSCAIAPSNDEDGTSTDTVTSTDTAEGSITEPEHLADSEPHEETSEKPPVTTEKRPVSVTTEVEDTSSATSDTQEPESPTATFEFSSNGNGTCSLISIGSYNESYVSIPTKSPDGDVVISIAERAFFGNTSIKAVEIPSTVMTIGDMAFSGCESLLYITVHKDNAMFTDIGGVLYSKDLSTLMCYPSGSGVSSLSIPLSVTVISPMAFYNCNSLKTVNYEGSFDDWSKITVGEKNYGLYTAAVCFNGENLQ